MKNPIKLFIPVCVLFLVVGLSIFNRTARSSGPVDNSIGLKMVRIEAGTFRMGSEINRDLWTEQPIHTVKISNPFFISETEATIEQYRQFDPSFKGNEDHAPYASGMSWHEASRFAEWLSRKEGKPYRLPTEAEWEYVARARIDDPGRQAKGRVGEANAWGVKNMLAGVREWCYDWFGEYSDSEQVDPVGPSDGMVRVVRGGALDLEERNFLKKDFWRAQARLAIAPSFGAYNADESKKISSARQSGLIGVWYDNTDMTKPQETDVLTRLNNNWSNDPRGGGDWSARWKGYFEAPFSGPVTFQGEAESPLRLEVNQQVVLDSWNGKDKKSGAISLKKGERYPIQLDFIRAPRGGDRMRIYWSWAGTERSLIPESALTFTLEEQRWADKEAGVFNRPGAHAVGIRLVQAPMPRTRPSPYQPPFVQQGVKQTSVIAAQGTASPYFRKRHLLPMPLENSPNRAIDALGMHPSFRRHNHSPGLEVLPNGDVLQVIYTSYAEYEPGVSLIASRLRFGADEWDMPSRLVDFVGVNDHAPLLWRDGNEVSLFWGNPKLAEGAFPFQWMKSVDNGATFQPIRFPKFAGHIGSHTKQPINTAFRDARGTIYVSSDGSGGESLLWASSDNGETWYDTGGRSAGRHTSFVPLKDGRILGMGGKNTNIDGFMPKAVSSDGGRTYQVSKTPFTWQGTNQRPTVARLQSGRLFFAGDFIYHNTGSQPASVNQLGSYVALSDDQGETWTIRKLIGAQLHENFERAERMKSPTLGYSVARQAPNGMIHLISTMNNPSLHFEFNEAWILEGGKGEQPDEELMASTATSIKEVKSFEERYPNGKPRVTWSGGVANDGRFVLHGTETWYYLDGIKQREAHFKLGKKVAQETYWNQAGQMLWSWNYSIDGSSVWTQYWPNGSKKSESRWRGLIAHGEARRWDLSGKLLEELKFSGGKIQN